MQLQQWNDFMHVRKPLKFTRVQYVNRKSREEHLRDIELLPYWFADTGSREVRSISTQSCHAKILLLLRHCTLCTVTKLKQPASERLCLVVNLKRCCTCLNLFNFCNCFHCRPLWPRGLRRRSAAVWLLGSRVRISLKAWMLVYCVCMWLSCVCGGVFDGPITHQEESYRVSNCVWWINVSTKEDKAQIWDVVS
jgi:hypothetical protein